MDELLLIFLSLVCSVCIGAPAFLLCRPFADLRGRRWQKALMLVGLGYMGSLPIWVGDPNLLYALPVFLAAFLLCTRGDLAGRLAVGVILFCLIMSLSALIDNYAAEVLWGGFTSDVFSLLLRAAALTGVWLVLKKRLPEQPVSLSPRLWRLVLGLAAMPLCSLAAVVLLTGGAEPSPQVDILALKMGLAVLPVALVTSVLLLFAILVLAEHEMLEQARRLASLREAYYQALRARESQVRQLRHDLRNHLSVLGGLMEQKRWAEACAYLDELGRQEGLQGPVRFLRERGGQCGAGGEGSGAGAGGRAGGFQGPAALLAAPVGHRPLRPSGQRAGQRPGGRGPLPRPLGAPALPAGQGPVHAAGGKPCFRPGGPGPCHHQGGPRRPRLRHPRHAGDRPAVRRHLAGRGRPGALLPAGQPALRAKLNRPPPCHREGCARPLPVCAGPPFRIFP